MDTSKEDSVNSAVNQTIKQFGRVDIAINNAGIGGAQKQTHDQELKDWQRVMDVNINGVWLCQRAQIRQMLKQEPLTPPPRGSRGVIVNTASMLGLVASSPVSAAVAYTTSKHGMFTLTCQSSLGRMWLTLWCYSGRWLDEDGWYHVCSPRD